MQNNSIKQKDESIKDKPIKDKSFFSLMNFSFQNENDESKYIPKESLKNPYFMPPMAFPACLNGNSPHS